MKKTNFFIQFNMINLIYYLLSLLSFIIFISFVLFYLYNFKLSQYKFIRCLQILTPILLILNLIILFYLNIITFNDVLFLDGDKNTSNTFNIGGNVEVNRDAAEALARNIGFAGTVAGVSGAVAKKIAKSTLPFIQKASIIVGSGVIGAGIHLVGSNFNKVINNNNTITSSTSVSGNNFSSAKTDFISGSTIQNSELKNVILGLDMISSACLSLIIILSILLLFKFFLNENKIKFI